MSNRKLLWLGFIGTIFSLICDLLLGWLVYPQANNPMIAMLASCADLSYIRLGLSALFGSIGIPMQYFGFKAIANIIKDSNIQKAKSLSKLVNAGAISTATMGASVHILCVALMVIIKLECSYGFDPTSATNILEAIPESAMQFALWGILPVSLIMMLPYYIGAVAMFIAIIKRYTYLPKWMCIFNPILAGALCNTVGMIIPNTAFANGLSMANMALGGMIPFLAIMIYSKVKALCQ